MKKWVFLLAFFFAGCSTQTFYMNNERSIEPMKEENQSFFINGIGQNSEIDAAKVCGGLEKVVKVEVEETFFNGFLSGITFGIYTPRAARVYCSS